MDSPHCTTTPFAHVASIGLFALLSLPLAVPAMAQSDDRANLEQASRIAEALKQAAVQSNTKQPGYFSDWQVKGDRIPLWSRQCIGREMTPQQFETNQATAGAIVVCILKDMVRQEIRSARNDESLTVRRVAAWWVTGDPGRYNANGVATYTQRVLGLYQPSGAVIAAQPVASPGEFVPIVPPQQIVPTQEIVPTQQLPIPGNPGIKPADAIKSAVPKQTPKPKETPKILTPTTSARPSETTPAPANSGNKNPNTPIVIKPTGTNFYDRYMQTGYVSSKEKNYKRAIVAFRRALDERPGDSFAAKAIENMEKLMTK